MRRTIQKGIATKWLKINLHTQYDIFLAFEATNFGSLYYFKIHCFLLHVVH